MQRNTIPFDESMNFASEFGLLWFCYVLVNPKTTHAQSSLPPPLDFTFLKNFSCLFGQMHMPHRLRASNPPPTNDYIPKFFHESLPFYSNVNILLDTTEIFSLSLGKLSYGDLFISMKLFIPESPRYCNIKRAFSKALK